MTSDRKTSDQSTTETAGAATEDVATTATLDSSAEPEASTTTARAAETSTSVEPTAGDDASSADNNDTDTASEEAAPATKTELPAETSETAATTDATDTPDTEHPEADDVSASSSTGNTESADADRSAEESAADAETETDSDAAADSGADADTDTDDTSTDDSAVATDEQAADPAEGTTDTADDDAAESETAVDATDQPDSEATPADTDAAGTEDPAEASESTDADAEADDTDEEATTEEAADAVTAPADEGFFENSGIRIAWRTWLPEEPARGVVVLVHGVAEHSGRYAHVGKRFTDAGFAVYAFDHAGHGESSGPRANIGSIDSAADNVQTVLELAGRDLPEVPKFVIGHSMGALIVLHLATRGPLDVAGVALSGPPLEISAGNTAQRWLAPVLTKLTPNLGVLDLDSAAISRDPEVVAAYNKDSLVFSGKLPVRTVNEILDTSIAVKARLDKLTVPTLAMHGSADTVADPASTDLIEKSAGATDLTVKRYEGLYHEIFNEPENDQVLGDVVDWLAEHVDNA